MMAATLIGFTGVAVRAETPESYALPPQWDALYALRTGGGYKDNVNLSHAAPQASGFVSAGGEVTALRLAPDAPLLVFLANADVSHYFTTGDEEILALAQAQIEEDFSETWKGSLALQYLYQDQVLDLSVVETNRQATVVRGHTLTLRPNVKRELPGPFWVTLETPVTRQLFAESLDDTWEAGPKLILGHAYGWGSELNFSYEAVWRWYDTDPARAADGTVIPGSHRERLLQEFRLTLRHNWDEQKRWRTTAVAAGRLNEENGDYFDHVRYYGALRMEYRAKNWEFSAGGRLAFYDYEYQTVSASDDSKRKRTEVSFEARAERQLSRHFKVLASYGYEETFSNDELETYSANVVAGSVQWEF